MLYDIDYSNLKDQIACFFRAKMNNGVIDVPAWDSDEVKK